MPSRWTICGGRLHHHSLAPRADAEGKIGILVIARRVEFVEAAELAEQRALDHQCRAGNPVGVAQETEGRFGGIALATPVPAVAKPPDDAAGLLQLAILEQQFRSGDADVRHLLECLHQFVEPAFLHQRVIVEEEQIFALGECGAGVAGANEAEIGRIAHDAHGAGEHQGGEHRLVVRAVVDDDDLERAFRECLPGSI